MNTLTDSGALPKEEGPKIKWPFKRMMNGHIAIVIDEFKYTGKIYVPDTAKKKPTKGRVICVADDVTDVEVGDKILYSQFAGYLLIFENLPQVRILGVSEVLAILNEDAPEVDAGGV